MSIILYTYSSRHALFVWPSLAINFDGDVWFELVWLSFGLGLCIQRNCGDGV